MPIISAKEVIAFQSAGMPSLWKILYHMPKRYEDRRRFDRFPMQAASDAVCLRGTVVDASLRRFGAGRRFYEAVVMDGGDGVFGSGKVTCRWFNMPFIHKLLAAGQEVILFGKVKDLGGRLIVDHPEFEIIRSDDHDASVHLERIVPIYRNISGISQRRLREIIHSLLLQVDQATLVSPLDVISTVPRIVDLLAVHFPDSIDQADSARRRFALEEFFEIQLNVAWRRARYQERSGRVLGGKTTLLKQFYANLPFDLTNAQKRSIKEILADMRVSLPMNRMLQGDVGTGKTFVAMAAMLLAIESGCQAALMAPTQILAEQHFLTFSHWLRPLGLRVALRTAGRKEDGFLSLEGEPQIIIGTHALLYDVDSFSDLGFVVIDEQHKFGVAQREALIGKGVTPDVLVMTATPIPRSLTMTIYGDLEVSLLDEKPAGRGKVITALRVAPKQTDVTRFVKEQLDKGRQAYLVYPLVEDSEALKTESATAAFEKWQKRLPKHQLGLIHGKLRPEEKEEVMTRFRNAEISVLVATSVIEVGVDVPNASVMIIHHAERFGLAQIHQLRGRIGRGGHKGFCVLLTDGKSEDAMAKLRVVEASSDGFEIAEADLKMRGPGDVLGTMQSGLSDLRFADYLTDITLLKEARAAANAVLSVDPMLEGEHQGLKALIDVSAVASPAT